MSGALRGRVAVVTGASSGIGEHTARQLAAAGAAVALLARRAERIAAIAGEIEAAGGRALAVPCDVTERAAIDAAVTAVAPLGRVDLLVNNAGVMLTAPFKRGRSDEWRRMVDLNLQAVFEVTDAFLGQLTDGGGDVVNVSSVAGRTTARGSAVYNATKWGLTGFSDALRKELLRSRVRVTAIEPGAVDTELVDRIGDDRAREGMAAWYQEVGALESADVADAIVYVVSRPPRVAISEVLIRPSGQEI
ncbi:SDR family oxidoreductase [Patulibacter defluvii]|uniref:SDR family oxidoreductase n=1 Tax=Patulibacter defluvii TaxID=3095358 RepID=UPI002A754108|nr:SDR family NAD(P)-dependent oxidoreductase [Patulibacter sp. DM4]